jgi:hypothetical protein
VCLTLAAHAALSVPPEELPARRQNPGPTALPAGLLKHADEQTVAGLAAVCRAAHDRGLGAAGCADWGVLAAPRFLGRTALAAALQRFDEEGAWGISPHLIPHRSLHSVSGTVSQALGLHGPNFGVGGGPDAAAEALLLAATVLAAGRVPGLWLVVTGGLPEADLPDPLPASAQAGATLSWQAVALALVPGDAGDRPRLEVGAGPAPDAARWPFVDLDSLMQALGGFAVRPAHWRLGCGGWARLCPAAAPREDRP